MSIMYRLEMKDGLCLLNEAIGMGPYREGFRAGGADGCGGDNTDTHPTPMNDPKLNRVIQAVKGTETFWDFLQPYVFGFRSSEQLHTWFSELGKIEEGELAQMQIGVYYVPDDAYIAGTFQCLGLAKHMIRVDTWEPYRKE